jgi:hypothetical protein
VEGSQLCFHLRLCRSQNPHWLLSWVMLVEGALWHRRLLMERCLIQQLLLTHLDLHVTGGGDLILHHKVLLLDHHGWHPWPHLNNCSLIDTLLIHGSDGIYSRLQNKLFFLPLDKGSTELWLFKLCLLGPPCRL